MTEATVAAPSIPLGARPGRLGETWRRLRRNRAAVVGGAIVVVYVIIALTAPAIIPYDYNAGSATDRLLRPAAFTWLPAETAEELLERTTERVTLPEVAEAIQNRLVSEMILALDGTRVVVRYNDGHEVRLDLEPGQEIQPALRELGVGTTALTSVQFKKSRPLRDSRFILGTDALGRDLLSRVLYGARISLIIQVFTVALAMLVGSALGLISGFYGGRIDSLIMRVMDVILAFPTLFLALAAVSAFRAFMDPMISLIIAVGFTSIPVFARIARGSVLSVKEKEYVEAARAIGERNRDIVLRYVLPNIMAPIIVQTTLRMATVLLTAAGLGFLGLGPDPSIPEWGNMVNQGRDYLLSSPHVLIIPGLAIMVVVLGFNMFGDGLRDALDPRLRQ